MIKSLKKNFKIKTFIKKLNQFDWIVIGCILILIFSIATLLVKGEQVPLQVSYFSWQGRKVGVKDKSFTLSFNRSVDTNSVEKNLIIEPPLPGRIVWQGRTLIYTLNDLPIYGTNYQIKLELENVQPKNESQNRESSLNSFSSLFSTRDRVFAYIGIEGEEKGRLILYNLTNLNQNLNQPKKTILTPQDLVVTDFRIYPDSEKILFSAFEPTFRNQGLAKQELYTVTTGFNLSPLKNNPPRAGKLKPILDAKEYQNVSFELSKNGQNIIVERVNHENKNDASLWMIKENEPPTPLGIPGSEFAISPDGKRLAVTQEGGIRMVPLGANGGTSRIFQNYQKSLGFSANGEKLLLLKDNIDYTRSLMMVNIEGETKELFRTPYPVLDCQFEPRDEQDIYCLKIDVIQEERGQYREEPFLSVINTEKGTDLPLLALPNYRDVVLSMSPDGVGLLFDQVVTKVAQSGSDLLTTQKQAIADGRVWLLPLPDLKETNPSLKIQPQELIFGFKPQWLP
ncbi:MAG: hypothetical protein QNJ64_09940 [Crocosphaera sp.]|nr:hypothetical protein [Crocosphaera sp.]